MHPPFAVRSVRNTLFVFSYYNIFRNRRNKGGRALPLEKYKSCCTKAFCLMQQLDSLGYYGSTGKFSNVILAHLFSHISFSPTPHSSGYASGLPPEQEKISTNRTAFILSEIP